ncbi:MAG TPA: hypothetical protein VFR42_08965, partial [Candidatus Acidoferrum sp.]|nr:hypothetical protein [Candidatus Acidoferrum sp.]
MAACCQRAASPVHLLKKPKISAMTANHKHDNPILVTGAAGAVGGVGRNRIPARKGHKVRALLRREDERA